MQCICDGPELGLSSIKLIFNRPDPREDIRLRLWPFPEAHHVSGLYWCLISGCSSSRKSTWRLESCKLSDNFLSRILGRTSPTNFEQQLRDTVPTKFKFIQSSGTAFCCKKLDQDPYFTLIAIWIWLGYGWNPLLPCRPKKFKLSQGLAVAAPPMATQSTGESYITWHCWIAVRFSSLLEREAQTHLYFQSLLVVLLPMPCSPIRFDFICFVSLRYVILMHFFFKNQSDFLHLRLGWFSKKGSRYANIS